MIDIMFCWIEIRYKRYKVFFRIDLKCECYWCYGIIRDINSVVLNWRRIYVFYENVW